MDNFIRKIFEIDQQAENYESELEQKKSSLLLERELKIKKIEEQFNQFLETEKNNLNSRVLEIQEKDESNLDKYKLQAQEIKAIFLQKKDSLVEEMAKTLLEGGV